MPRDIPVGNGRLLITFDNRYQVRDLYFPHVGEENHAGAGPCHFGIYADLPNQHQNALLWTLDPSWKIRQRYLRNSLTTSVALDNAQLKLSLYCNDAVDFHRSVMVRKIKLKNEAGHDRKVQILHHQDFNMFGQKLGDTAYYDPELQSIIHYRGQRYLLVTFFDETGKQRLDEYATGAAGFHGAEGTWRDAEDGKLEGNPISQGAVDSTVSHHVHIPANGETTAYMVIIAGHSREELLQLHQWLLKNTPQGVLDRTTSYWRLWIGAASINFGNLPPKVVDLFKRSLLIIRTQTDNNGAILAANDSDILQFSRDTYSYMWPRDGALVATALDSAGFSDIAKAFYSFCQKVITPEGYFHHKYNPDGSPASSWHPWVLRGKRVLPIQEDETALVVWSIWKHFQRYRDIEYIRPLWVDVVQKAADFMVRYRDENTGLPLPSYDLWEERWGVHAYTVATVHAALIAARNFALCFAERSRAELYERTANEIRQAAEKYLYNARLGRFVRRLVPRESISPARSDDPDSYYEIDDIVDASMHAIYEYKLFSADDPRVEATMSAIGEKLSVKTLVGGVARYENDSYHRISNDIRAVPGNPWFICTLWMADYCIARASDLAELKKALPIIEWVASHALESGVLAEQVHPHTNEPISVSPLTWSHAGVVGTVIRYLEKLESLGHCPTCHQPVFRMRSLTPGEEGHERPGQESSDSENREMLSPAGHFAREEGTEIRQVRLSIDVADCIGCDMCVAHCQRGVLRMVEGKALIDGMKLSDCDLDGQCVDICPTQVVILTIS